MKTIAGELGTKLANNAEDAAAHGEALCRRRAQQRHAS